MRNDPALGQNGFFKERGKEGVLFIHGVTGTPTEMWLFSRPFETEGYTITCPQLKGHCGTYEELKQSQWADWLESVEKAYQFLVTKCDRVFVVGLSAGGLLALKLCLKHPEIAGVVVLSPMFFFDGWNIPWYKKAYAAFVLMTPLRYFWTLKDSPPYGLKDKKMRERVIRILKSRDHISKQIGHLEVPAVTVYECVKLIRAVRKELKSVHTPTLIVHSLEDDFCSDRNALFLKENLGSKTVECLYIDDSYHVLTLDKKKHEVAEKTIAFFKKLRNYP